MTTIDEVTQPSPFVLALRRVAQIAWVACLVGVPIGAGTAAVSLAQYARPFELAPGVVAFELTRGLSLGTAGVVIWLVGFMVLTPMIQSPQWRARAAALPPWLYVQMQLIEFANAVILPGLPTWQRASIHAGFAVALLITTELASRAACRWHASAFLPGRPPPLASTATVVFVLATIAVIDHRTRDLGEKPNVIVILIDVLRADRLGSYGYARDTSPNLDRFAADAVVFERAISQSSFTKTSISSLFSALYPYRHGVYHGSLSDTASNITSDVLPDSITTLAEALRDDGYLTGAWVKNEQLRAYMGFDQGFDLYRDQPGSAERIAREFRRWQRTWGSRRTFFAYLHVLELHGPYRPPPPYDTMFGTYDESVVGMTGPEWRSYRKAVRKGERTPSAAQIEQLSALYDGELAWLDRVVGGIFDELKREGLYEDALIVVTGDHGDGFMEHGFLAHSNTPYEELVHVPLIVKLPGAKHAGRRIATPMALVDVLPTLLEAVDAPPVAGIDGLSQLALLEGSEDEADARVIVSEFEDCIAVRDGDWKYLTCPDVSPALFDLARDPGEQTNAIETQPGIADRLARIVEKARAQQSAPRERVIVDPETVEALKALGYL